MRTKLLLLICFFALTTAMQAQNPVIWGMAPYGGTYNGGTIYSMNADGSNFNVAFNFQPPEGFTPMGDLLQASDGQLYGTCFNGGSYGSCTMFRFMPGTGTYTDVYDFNIIDGDYPTSGVVEGTDGMLYGATPYGGSSYVGVIYRFDPILDVYTNMYDLESTTGANPQSSPIYINGKLYGTTLYGGDANLGAIYSFDVSTSTYTAIHIFDDANGANPYGGLVQFDDGKLYGMTSAGGTNGKGVMYRIDISNNSFEKLYDFTADNGGAPQGNLMQGTNGLLYGMTKEGGTNNKGVIFSYDLYTSAVTNLFNFNTNDGKNPVGSLMQSNSTTLCGTTAYGGTYNNGVAFSFDLYSGTYTKILEFDGINGSNPNGGFITLSVETGIAQTIVNELNVYPNPASDVAWIQLSSFQNENVFITVKDLSGKEVFANQLTTRNGQLKLDIGNLSSGLYFIEAVLNDKKMTSQLVKE